MLSLQHGWKKTEIHRAVSYLPPLSLHIYNYLVEQKCIQLGLKFHLILTHTHTHTHTHYARACRLQCIGPKRTIFCFVHCKHKTIGKFDETRSLV